MANTNINIRRDDDLLCGRLVALPTTSASTAKEALAAVQSANASRGFRNIVSIDFPAMPDTLELARSTDYAVNWNLVLPDGIHQYRGTKPMEIPISFKLHFGDPYCKQGALTLLQLAGRLHSFTLPVSTFQRGVTVIPQVAPTPNTTGRGATPAPAQESTASQNVYQINQIGGNKNGQIFSPVTCWLHLMWVDEASPGVSCIGYVKDVKVVFFKPWLRGPNNSFNLPSSAEYSFTFVHRPGHGNSLNAGTTSAFPQTIAETPQAFADDVKDGLYNTRSLVFAANYQGFAGGNTTK